MIVAPIATDRLTSAATQSLQPGMQPAAASETADAFGAMLGEAAAATVAKLGQAETLSVKALQGEAETREVVDAVMGAEQSLQAAIAIRDKIVTAYLEISRMAI